MFKSIDGTNRLLGLTVDPNDTNVNKLIVSSTTSSGSPTTGALTVAGGVGIAGNLNVGGGITGGSISYASTTTGTLAVTNTTNSTSATTGVLTVAGGVGIAKDVYTTGKIDVTGPDYGNIRVRGTNIYISAVDLDSSPQPGGKNWRLMSTHDQASEGQGRFCIQNVTGGVTPFYISPSGKVGIGGPDGSAALTVYGDTRSSGFGTYNNAYTPSEASQAIGPSGFSITYDNANITLKSKKVGLNTAGFFATPAAWFHLYGYDGTIPIHLKLESPSIDVVQEFHYSGSPSYKSYITQALTGQFIVSTNSNTQRLDLQTSGGLTKINGNLQLAGVITTSTSTYASPGVTIDNSGTASNTTFLIKTPSLPNGSETLFVLGRSLTTNQALQIGYAPGATAANAEIVISQYGDGNSGIRIKNSQLKIGSGSYFGYEEGTWTPQLWFCDRGGAAEQIPTGGYNSRSGTYVKIGKKVTLYFAVDFGYPATFYNSIVLTNLPFMPAYGTSINSQMSRGASEGVELTGLGKPYFINYEYGFSGTLTERFYFYNYANIQFVPQIAGASGQGVKGVIEFITS